MAFREVELRIAMTEVSLRHATAGPNAAEREISGGGVGRDLRMRSEKSLVFPAASAASLM